MENDRAREQWLDDLEFKHGRDKGRLVAAMDLLSDAQIKVGTHSAYCKSPAPPGRPSADIEEVLSDIARAKDLLATVIHE